MKKRLLKILRWDHFSQVVFVLGAIPSLVCWARGHGSMFGVFVSGFNIGAAVYWQFYLSQRKRLEWWMDRALKPGRGESREMFDVAKNLVEARMKSGHIDPDRN